MHLTQLQFIFSWIFICFPVQLLTYCLVNKLFLFLLWIYANFHFRCWRDLQDKLIFIRTHTQISANLATLMNVLVIPWMKPLSKIYIIFLFINTETSKLPTWLRCECWGKKIVNSVLLAFTEEWQGIVVVRSRFVKINWWKMDLYLVWRLETH